MWSKVGDECCCREAATGNDLSSGLKQSLAYMVDMRRCKVDGIQPIPAEYVGNAVGVNLVMPIVTTPTSSTLQLDHLMSLLAAAACAIHSATKTMRADSAFIRNSTSLVESCLTDEFWYAAMIESGFSPFRDCAAFMSSWRGGTMDKMDFGHGTPWVILGKPRLPAYCPPWSQNSSSHHDNLRQDLRPSPAHIICTQLPGLPCDAHFCRHPCVCPTTSRPSLARCSGRCKHRLFRQY